MNASPPGPYNLQGLPTLTEVIDMTAAVRDESANAGPAPAAPVVAEPAPAFSEEQIVQRVMADLQRSADLMLEYRLREALTPILSRLAEALIRDVRDEFAATLRDVVARAVSQELARRRGR